MANQVYNNEPDELATLQAEIERLKEEIVRLKAYSEWVDEFVRTVADPSWIL